MPRNAARTLRPVASQEKAMSEYFCDYCSDNLADPEDPTGQADCRFCGGSFAWKQRKEWEKMKTDWNKRTDTVKITSVRIGSWFECISGRKWKLTHKRDNGVVDAVDEHGKEDTFAGCATVIPIQKP